MEWGDTTFHEFLFIFLCDNNATTLCNNKNRPTPVIAMLHMQQWYATINVVMQQ